MLHFLLCLGLFFFLLCTFPRLMLTAMGLGVVFIILIITADSRKAPPPMTPEAIAKQQEQVRAAEARRHQRAVEDKACNDEIRKKHPRVMDDELLMQSMIRNDEDKWVSDPAFSDSNPVVRCNAHKRFVDRYWPLKQREADQENCYRTAYAEFSRPPVPVWATTMTAEQYAAQKCGDRPG